MTLVKIEASGKLEADLDGPHNLQRKWEIKLENNLNSYHIFREQFLLTGMRLRETYTKEFLFADLKLK